MVGSNKSITPIVKFIIQYSGGTTALWDLLVQHPQVTKPYDEADKQGGLIHIKELKFWNTDDYTDKGLALYESIIHANSLNKLTGERNFAVDATPGTMASSKSASRILKAYPNNNNVRSVSILPR